MKKKVFEVLDGAGIKYRCIEHEPVYTVADVGRYFPDKYPVKNLLLKEEKGERCVFVVMNGDERLDTKQLAKSLGCKKLQFAKPEILMSKLGVEPGSASLFSLIHEGSKGLEVVIDQRLLEQPEIGFHPSLNTETIMIDGQYIPTFLEYLGVEFKFLAQ
ncbi:hypothetical protein KC930_02075 [Candidatus Saccharibacteria bacterium]|nr:hypothetical protein [Candidatus Saccharibacteria bacterium]